MKKIQFLFALSIGKIVCKLVNVIDKEKGTNLAGKIACKIQKDFISHFKGIDYNKVFFITGTNGKSTTNNMVVHTLRNSGKKVTSNLEGANLLTGVATALIKDSTIFGKLDSDFFVFETDERYLSIIHKYLPAKNICITNIQKDQVQRNGEPDYIYQKIKAVITKDTTLYLNNEEPRSKSLAKYAGNSVFYGVEKNEKSFEKNDFYDVSLPCPICNDKIKFDYYNVDNIGKFRCTNCDFKSEEKINFPITDINYKEGSFKCLDYEYFVNNTEAFFIYNYALCIAICKTFGIDEKQIQEAFKNFKNIGGRIETLYYKEKTIKYIRIKQENPETLQSALDYISCDNEPKIFVLGLEELKDFKPYYTNTFYAFDCNIDKLISSNVERYICFSEAVAYDSANRLIYAGIDKDKISILPTDNDTDIMQELDKYDINNVYLITWLKKYYELDKYIKNNKEDIKDE